jgi:hypothetical protein
MADRDPLAIFELEAHLSITGSAGGERRHNYTPGGHADPMCPMTIYKLQVCVMPRCASQTASVLEVT